MKEFFTNLKFTWQYAKEHKGKLIRYILCNVVSIIISVVTPILSAKVIVALTSNALYQLLLISIVIFIVENLNNLVSYFAEYYSQFIYRETFTKLQTSLGQQILKLENQIIDAHGSGVFIQRLTNDTSRLADIFNVLNMYVSSIIANLGIFGAIFLINKTVFLYLALSVVLLYLIEHIRTQQYMEKDSIYRKKNELVSSFVGEIVRGLRDIKMLNAEKSFINELHHKVVDLNETRYEMGTVNRKYGLLRRFTRDTIDLLLIVLIVLLLINHQLEVASALVLYNYSSRVPDLIYHIGTLLDGVTNFNLSSSRIFSIIESDKFKKESFGTIHLDKVNGDFSFKNVTFSYGKETVLRDISFDIKANETVAFVGKSGAGKTTIFNLLCKMYQVDHGEISIDGININELDKDSIRGNITIIQQNPYIFHLSIRDNLRLVKNDLTEEDMIEACKLACLHDFIMSLPDQYDTIIGEGGINLSGGQKQRLAIARALIQKTEIILFDEATSALDNETQSKIQEAIDHIKNEYTILIIAHRLSTIINSDRILFLEDGKITAEGTHTTLLKKSKAYKQLYEAEIKHADSFGKDNSESNV